MTYEVTIELLEQIEYKGILSLDNNKIYIRSLVDLDEYEAMFWQLIKNGYVDVQRDGIDYDISVTDFKNNLTNIFEKLQNDGLNISFVEIANDAYSFSLVADGDDINPNVIAYLGKGTKFIALGESLFKCANNVDYEPKINIRAASYAVDIQEVQSNIESLRELINTINNGILDVNRYLNDINYAKVIKNLFDVVAVETLTSLNIHIPNEQNLTLNVDAIKILKRNFKNLLANADFNISVFTHESLRAFDDKKHKVVLDISPTYYLHFLSIELYDTLKSLYAQNKKVSIEGTYKSKQTIEVSRIVEVR